jgi:hypothetical protein
VRGPSNGNTDHVEPGLPDRREIIVLDLDAPGAFLRRFQHVAEVDAVIKWNEGGEYIGARQAAQGEARQQDAQK